MIDPSQRLVPSTAPEDHPIHGAAEAGDLARVCAFLDQEPSLVHDVNRAGGHPLHRAVIGGSAKVVMLLLDRGADIHAIHGAGVGSLAGYAPQDKQPIDLAIWGGPCQVPVSKWRSFVSVLKWRLWKRWSDGQVWPCNVPLARLLISRGATYDLTVASALERSCRGAIDARHRPRHASPSSVPTIVARFMPPPSSAVSTSSACCWHAARIRRGPTPIRPSAARPCMPRPGVATGRWSNCC